MQTFKQLIMNSYSHVFVWIYEWWAYCRGAIFRNIYISKSKGYLYIMMVGKIPNLWNKLNKKWRLPGKKITKRLNINKLKDPYLCQTCGWASTRALVDFHQPLANAKSFKFLNLFDIAVVTFKFDCEQQQQYIFLMSDLKQYNTRLIIFLK